MRSWWQKRAQQTYSSELMEVSVPAEDGSQQSSTFTRVHHRPVTKYHTQAYIKHKQKIMHYNKNNTHSPNSSTKFINKKISFINNKIIQNSTPLAFVVLA
jgi:hypothetical protein